MGRDRRRKKFKYGNVSVSDMPDRERKILSYKGKNKSAFTEEQREKIDELILEHYLVTRRQGKTGWTTSPYKQFITRETANKLGVSLEFIRYIKYSPYFQRRVVYWQKKIAREKLKSVRNTVKRLL